MKPRKLVCFLIVLFFVSLITLVSCKKQVATAKKECFCSDGTVSVQDCRVDGSGCETCKCTEYSLAFLRVGPSQVFEMVNEAASYDAFMWLRAIFLT